MQAADRHDLLPGHKRSMTRVKTLKPENNKLTSYFHYYSNTIVTALVCHLYDEFWEKNSLTDKFPSLLFVWDFQRLQRKILWPTKIALVSCSTRNRHISESETGCRQREITLNGFMPVWILKEAREKSTMASCSQRFPDHCMLWRIIGYWYLSMWHQAKLLPWCEGNLTFTTTHGSFGPVNIKRSRALYLYTGPLDSPVA